MRHLALRLSQFVLFLFVGSAFARQTTPPALPPPSIPHSLSLFEAEQLLVERNLLVSASRSQLAATAAGRRIAGFKPNPQLQLGMEQVPFRSPVLDSVPRFFATNGNAGANPVYTAQLGKLFERGGKREMRILQADAQVGAASAQIEDTLRTQRFLLRQAFGNALLARDNLRLAAEIDTQYAKTEDLTAVRVKAGDLPGIELYRLQAGRLQFQQAVIDAQSAYEQASRDLLSVLSGRSEDVLRFAGRPTSAEPVSDLVQSAPLVVVGEFSQAGISEALDQLKILARTERPDLKVAKANLQAAAYGVRLAQAQRARDINLATEYQRVGDDDTLGVVTEIPLFLYNNGKAGVEQAQATRAVAEAQLHQLEVQVDTDVEKAYQSYLAAKRSVSLYSGENLKQVEKVREIIEFSYQHGAASLLELLDAERTVRQANSAYNQARANYQLSIWQLDSAVGRDLQ